MLKPPKLGGAGHLRLFVDQIGFDRACKIVDVHPGTMRRWLRDDPTPPQGALQALYWLSSYGMSDAAAEAHWTHQWLLSRLRTLEGNPKVESNVGNIARDAANGLWYGLRLVKSL